jgi:hypothetical protein
MLLPEDGGRPPEHDTREYHMYVCMYVCMYVRMYVCMRKLSLAFACQMVTQVEVNPHTDGLDDPVIESRLE